MEDTFFKSVFNLTNKIKNEKLDPQRGHILYVYTLSVIIASATILLRGTALLFFSRRVSVNLHSNLITNVITASVKFFDTNFIGNIWNRFAKDLTVIDEAVPFTLHNCLQV